MRLNCDRAFVSLIDNQHQYVAAEMTKDVSLVDSSRHPPGMPVCIGATVLDLVAGVCAGTMPAFLSDSNSISTSNVFANRSRYVINDFSQEETYRNRPYVTGYPHMRYYAEVPITASSGHVIGTYAVVDNKPRTGLDDEQYLILADIAEAIMRHLETLKIESDHNRASTLLRGLDTFVQRSKTTSTRPRKSPGSVQMRGSSYASGQTDDAGPDYCPVEAAKSSLSRQSLQASYYPNSELGYVAATSLPLSQHNISELAARPKPSRNASATSTENSLALVPELPSIENVSEADINTTSSEAANASESFTDTFSRAARLVREAMDLEGVLFLDASFTGFGSRVEPDWLDESITSSPDEPRAVRSPISPTSQTKAEKTSLPRPASCLGSSIRSSNKTNGQYSLPQSIHQSLIRHFPLGEVFVLAADLSTTSINLQLCGEPTLMGEPSSRVSMRRKYSRRLAMEDALRSYFPGAQTVLFFPLRDPYKSNWFGGSIAWSTQSKRIFERQDFSYFSVFSNSVMLEIARLEMVASDRAMSDFISSISHELRSPLHGILGSAELLRDTESTTDHDQLIGSIENCGQALLETMDQILEFSKINAKSTSKKQQNSEISRASEYPARLTSSAKANLTALIEESVQGLLLGQRYKKSHQFPDSFRHVATSGTAVDASHNSVLVIVSLDRRANVIAGIETAAWHRIVLNVVGNAMKYTTKGRIEISLIMADISRALFIVSDTGSGIGGAFLRNHIFTPFAQENPLSDGTGLGMSIVKQLLDSLGGSIGVDSEVGKGTRVTIAMPLSQGRVPPAIALPQYPEVRVAMLALGQSVVSSDSSFAASTALRNAVAKNTEDWYGVRMTEIASIDELQAGILFLNEVDFLSLGQSDRSQDTTIKIPGGCSFIIACTQHGIHNRGQHVRSDRVFYLHPPYGPHQVGAVLRATLAVDNSGDVSLDVRRDLDSAAAVKSQPQSRSQGMSRANVEEADSTSKHGSANAVPESIPSLPAESISTHIPAAQRPRVLLVDDNHLNLNILVKTVQRFDCDFVTAMNGLEAVQKFQDAHQHISSNGDPLRPFDYVFMDISMPVMNGFEATRAIRNYEREMARGHDRVQESNAGRSPQLDSEPDTSRSGSQSPSTLPDCQIIAMTGLEEALTSGMNKFWKKPVQIKMIRALLEGGI